MLKDSALAFLRHALTTAGGGLATGGVVTNDELAAGVGAVVTLAGIAWSIVDKYLKSRSAA